MNQQNEKPNRNHRIEIIMDRRLSRVERINLYMDGRLHQDAVIGELAKMFRPGVWGALRGLVHIDDSPLFMERG